MIRDVLGALGSWDVRLADDTPDEIVQQLDYFGHIAVLRGPVDVTAVGDNALRAARYVGVLRERTTAPGVALSGAGMLAWAGDEDGKGPVLEDAKVFTNATFANAVTALIPAAVRVGTIFPQTGAYTGTHQYETARSALDTVCDAFGAEWFIGGDGKLYAGKTAQLYSSVPSTVVSRRNVGSDLDLTALGGHFDATADVIDYSTRVVLIGQNTGGGNFATGSAEAPALPYRDLFGGTVKVTRLISETGTTTGSVASRAQLALNRFNRRRVALKITADRYETDGTFRVGEYTYVYDPESGVFDAARDVTFRGELIHPDTVRVSSVSYPLSEDHSVGFRRGDGTWIDLTRWVVWETGTTEIVVGDLPRSLGGASDNAVQGRADAAAGVVGVDIVAPKPPTALDVQTTVLDTGSNGLVGQATVNWAAPTQNVDNTALTDLAGYLVQYRLSTSPLWTALPAVGGTGTTITVVPGRSHDYRVFAQDTNGNLSDPSSTVSVVTALDTTPPSQPADPGVSSYIGQLRIAWSGRMADASGPPADFSQMEVHVSSDINFAPDVTTLVGSLLQAGVVFATAPYGATRYAKFVALDQSGNRSPSSTAVAGKTGLVRDTDVSEINVGKLTAGVLTAEVTLSGRIATAASGARVELNSSGIYKVDANGTYAVAIDGARALLTGTYMTAATGRRIEIGSAGTTGKIDFYAPDGKFGTIRAFTEGTGLEALRLEGPHPAGDTNFFNNVINLNSEGFTSYRSRVQQTIFRDSYSIFLGSGPMGTTDNGKNVLTIDGGNTFSLYSVGSDVTRWRRSNDGSVFSGIGDNYYWQTASGSHIFQVAGRGRIGIIPSNGTGDSPWLQLVASTNYGVVIRAAAGGAPLYVRAVVRTVDDSGYADIAASGFAVNSDMRGKRDIEELSASSALDEVMAMTPSTYRRKSTGDLKTAPVNFVESASVNPTPAPGPVERGFVAQNMPDGIRDDRDPDGLAVDLYALVTTLTAAFQHHVRTHP